MNQPALPAFLQQRQSKALTTDLSANLGIGSPPYISIMGNRFTLIDSAGDEEPIQTTDPQLGYYLDCVIIDNNAHISKVFYDKPFDPNSGQYEPPACFSDNGFGPSRSASKPQSNTCADCKNNVWGSKVSAVSGKGVKACSDFQKLAIMIPGDEVIFLLRVPPNSLSNLRAYNQKFIGQKVDVSDVITRMWFEPGQIGLLQFNAVSVIDQASFSRREQLLLEHKTDALVGKSDLPRQEALPSPQQPAPQSIAQPAAPLAAIPASQPSPLPLATQPQPGIPMHSPVGGATTASPTEAPRQRRRRNTAAPAQAAPAAAPVAPFRPQASESALPPQPTFGMQPAAAAPADVNAALDNLFGPKS